MAIIRSKNTSEYFILSNQTAQDGKLQMASLGLLTYMLSKPVDWVFYETELAKHFEQDSLYGVKKAINDLKKNGYLIVGQKRTDRGKFGTRDWTVLDKSTFSPQVDIPSAVTPSTVSPSAVRRPLQSTDSTKYRSKQSTQGTKILSGKPDDTHSADYNSIVGYLNERAGTAYKPTSKKTQALIRARMNEGFKVDDFKQAIDTKVDDWLNDQNMNKYLRPETLFSPKFEGYLNESKLKPREEETEDGASW